MRSEAKLRESLRQSRGGKNRISKAGYSKIILESQECSILNIPANPPDNCTKGKKYSIPKEKKINRSEYDPRRNIYPIYGRVEFHWSPGYLLILMFSRSDILGLFEGSPLRH
jgi:hypothetical protein